MFTFIFIILCVIKKKQHEHRVFIVEHTPVPIEQLHNTNHVIGPRPCEPQSKLDQMQFIIIMLNISPLNLGNN